MTAPPPWLADWQARFGATLRQPLDPSSGTFRPQPERYDPALLEDATPAHRVAFYHQQGWMRLFDGLQRAWPRSARAIGYWPFNQLASRYLAAAPPAHPDLDRAADGFAPTLRGAVADTVGLRALGVDPAMLRQAVDADAAERHAAQSPWTGVWTPRPSELADLAGARLRYAPSVSVVREQWTLAKLPAGPIGRHAGARWHVYARTEDGTAIHRVEPALARLLWEARRGAFGDALRAAEAEASADHVAAHLDGWIRLALGAGWWIGVQPGQPAPC